jgi:hypothetical protein
MTKLTLTQEQVNAIVQEAMIAAKRAALDTLNRDGDRDCCGFAWCNIYGVKGNTKIGRMLKAAGVRQDYTKAFQLWNPAQVPVQSMNVLEAGAEAAAQVFRKYGFTALAGSRLD